MKNLQAKEREQLLQNATPVEYIVTIELDTLSEGFSHLMRPFQWLHDRAKETRGGTKKDGNFVSFVNTNGQRKSVTLYTFIISGLPHIQKGLTEVLNIKDDVERTSEMLRLEALVRLLCRRTSKKRYDEVTEEMIKKQIETTERLEPAYDEEMWGIELKSVFGSEAVTIESRANDYSNVLG